MTDVNQSSPVTVTQSRSKKSMPVAMVLTVMFGPLGLLYASPMVGVIMIIGGMFTGCAVLFDEAEHFANSDSYAESFSPLEEVGLFLWLVSIVLCFFIVRHHNRDS